MSRAEKYIELGPQIAEATGKSLTSPAHLAQLEGLRWLDEHRDQTPGPTITESELKGVNEWLPDTAQIDSPTRRDVAEFFGTTVVPDPVLTNAEKLAEDIEDLGVDWDVARDMARSLDLSGWKKAPGGDDEH